MEMQVLVELTKKPTFSVNEKVMTEFSLNLAYATLYSYYNSSLVPRLNILMIW